MPKLNGIELIKSIRSIFKPAPIIIMLTALSTNEAKTLALESGADDFLSKPIHTDELIYRIIENYEIKNQKISKFRPISQSSEHKYLPHQVGIGIATSTGGPPTVMEIFKNLKSGLNISIFLVQHGPDWMLNSFAKRISDICPYRAFIADEFMPIKSGEIYIAANDAHLTIDAKGHRIHLDKGPRENLFRPSADPLFRSLAHGYSEFLFGIVLTGLGRDGTNGSAEIVSAGGTILVQDPDTAIAPFMPQSVIDSQIKHLKLKTEQIAPYVNVVSEQMFLELSLKRDRTELIKQ